MESDGIRAPDCLTLKPKSTYMDAVVTFFGISQISILSYHYFPLGS